MTASQWHWRLLYSIVLSLQRWLRKFKEYISGKLGITEDWKKELKEIEEQVRREVREGRNRPK